MSTDNPERRGADPLIELLDMLRLHRRLDAEEANALERAHLATTGRDPHVDWPAVEHLVDAAIRRGDITTSRGAEILGITLRTWRERALEIRKEGNPLAASEPVAAEETVEVRDARRYWRLRVLGAAPYGTKHLDDGTVIRFTTLDSFVDEDIARNPSRGEAELR